MSRIAVAFLFFVLAVSSFAQQDPVPRSPETAPPGDQPPKPSRPRIGIALEGGGALGFAHIGVLGLRHRKLSVGSGLNTGHDVSMLIDRETLAYSNLESFDQLPIPFRCVATDLVSAKEKVFEDGSLQTALRATMSIPALFSPVREDDHVYVDGGLLGNLPTDVVRKMGAEIVIAVHLEVAPTDPKKIQSVFD